ncbi:MAG TPA: hypothetical protein VF662_01010 [Allosphingosinicella sp.]|jgi:hypothetical protein
MAGLGFGIGLGLAPRGRSQAPSLMPAQTVMLVAGDSLGGQAGNGSSHPLLWATRRVPFDLAYDYRLHNIAVGTTSADGDAATIPVGSPIPENVRRGLIHPERISRDQALVAATGAKVLLLEVGTNSVPSSGAAGSFANVQTYVAAMKAVGVERVIVGALQPRMSGTSTPNLYMTPDEAKGCREFNALLRGWAASDGSVYVYDGSAGETDQDHVVEYGPLGGGANTAAGASTYDGVHWGTAHALRRQDQLVEVLARIFPVRADRPYSLGSDYSWSMNRYGNVLGHRAGFVGAGSYNPFSGGPSGSFGDGWVCNSSSALPAGVTVIGSEVQVTYAGALRNAIKVSVTGTPAADFSLALQKASAVPLGTDADHKLRMDGSEKLLHEWVFELENIRPAVIADLGIGSPGTVGGTSPAGSGFNPVVSGRYVWREPGVGPVSSAAASCVPKIAFYFRGGVPVSGSITFIHAFLGHSA